MGEIRVSKKELARHKALALVEQGKLTMPEAAGRLGISVRQLRRSRRRHEQAGLQSLGHKSRGRPSGRALSPQNLAEIKRLLHGRYPDFSATYAAEKISKDLKLSISNEKVRQLQISEGLHRPKKRKKGKYHPRRKRRSREGELVQSDGSVHDWLEGRGAPMSLITYIDDATSKIKHAKFVACESTQAYMQLTREYIEQFGCPRALYVDKHSIFRQNNGEVRDQGRLTNFGEALRELDIELICAHSPQAKGRVERGFGTLQDRLIKDMRLAKLSTMQEANEFLPQFLDDHNRRFGVSPADPEDGHLGLPGDTDLTQAFTTRETRKLSKNLSFQFNNVLYQVLAPNEVNRLRNRQVEIRLDLSGEMSVRSSWGKSLKFECYQEFSRPPQLTLDSKELSTLWPDKRRKPGKNHPWRNG